MQPRQPESNTFELDQYKIFRTLDEDEGSKQVTEVIGPISGSGSSNRSDQIITLITMLQIMRSMRMLTEMVAKMPVFQLYLV
jgi:hypothetical protein